MHISTHHDRIWTTGCLQEEASISDILKENNVQHRLVDAITCHPHDLDKQFATDNQFDIPVDYINLAPEFWHIYRCPEISDNLYPNRHFNCMMNRISGDRLQMLYMLAEADMLDKGYISFNCLDGFTQDPEIDARIKNYKNMHEFTCEDHYSFHKYDQTHEKLLTKMPMFLDMDPDQAAMLSDITLVIETYTTVDHIVAFSEKIFRALQTPRPWLLLCSPGSVAVLRSAGFDVMDDVVDHSYDEITDQEKKYTAIIQELKKPKYFFLPRYKQAVETNQALLDRLKLQWSYKLQSIISNNQR